jgi:hypothetical protein
MDVEETRREDTEWVQWLALVDAVMNLWIAENAGNEEAFGFYAVTEGILNGGGLKASAACCKVPRPQPCLLMLGPLNGTTEQRPSLRRINRNH